MPVAILFSALGPPERAAEAIIGPGHAKFDRFVLTAEPPGTGWRRAPWPRRGHATSSACPRGEFAIAGDSAVNGARRTDAVRLRGSAHGRACRPICPPRRNYRYLPAGEPQVPCG